MQVTTRCLFKVSQNYRLIKTKTTMHSPLKAMMSIQCTALKGFYQLNCSFVIFMLALMHESISGTPLEKMQSQSITVMIIKLLN